MIEINLVPPHLQKKRKSRILEGLEIPKELLIGIGGGAVALLILIHFILLIVNIGKFIEYKSLEKKWTQMSTLKQGVDSVVNESRGLQGRLTTFQELMGQSNILWSNKLNILSDTLPRGVWLKKIELSHKIFFLEGSAISRQGEEMINVHNFTSALKKDSVFLNNFRDLKLGSIQTRKFEKIEIADFSITTNLDE